MKGVIYFSEPFQHEIQVSSLLNVLSQINRDGFLKYLFKVLNVNVNSFLIISCQVWLHANLGRYTLSQRLLQQKIFTLNWNPIPRCVIINTLTEELNQNHCAIDGYFYLFIFSF